MLNVVTVAAQGPGVGLGHVRRAQVAADAFRARGAQVRQLVVEAEPPDLGPAPGRAVVVVDGYDLGPPFTGPLRAQGWFVVQLDDLGDRPLDADLVVNPNGYGAEVAYAAPAVGGLAFALVAPAFAALRHRTRPAGILVAFGGADRGQLAAAVAHDLAVADPGLVVHAIVPDPDLAAPPSVRCTFHRQADLAELMAEVTTYVGGAGVTAHEATAAGLGVVVCSVAPNQDRNADFLGRHGIEVVGATDPTALATAARRAVAAAAGNPLTQLVDGRGGERLADAVLQHLDSAASR